ncbi:hypothetical protein AAH427_09925 [Klebsiella pneumoniae]|uniref:hypothetical protein n=1 Tax=Klebsiella pneumoniae TaxID=573 RepID=UPI0035A21BC6
MALTLLATNNAESTLASAISATDTSLIVSAGTGAEFPDAVAGESYFKLTITDAATGSQVEIVNVTAKAGDIFTIERAQEGTLARAWAANDMVANMMTADTLNVIADFAKQAFDSAEEAQGYALSASEFGDNKSTFADTTAGLAATTSGQYFRIPQGTGNVLAFRYYKNNSGVAQEVAEYPGQGSITNTIREFPTLAAAQADADAGNILSGSTAFYRSPDDSALAIEVINNAGTLEPTGVKIPSYDSIKNLIGLNENTRFIFPEDGEYEFGIPFDVLLEDAEHNIIYTLNGNKFKFYGDVEFDSVETGVITVNGVPVDINGILSPDEKDNLVTFSDMTKFSSDDDNGEFEFGFGFDVILEDMNGNLIYGIKGTEIRWFTSARFPAVKCDSLMIDGVNVDPNGIPTASERDALNSYSESTVIRDPNEFAFNPKVVLVDSENNILIDYEEYNEKKKKWDQIKPQETNPLCPWSELDSNGKYQISVMDISTHQQIQVTSGASNETNPRPDVLDRIVWQSDRADPPPGGLFYAQLPDFTPHAYIARKKIVGWGHSFINNGAFLRRIYQLTGLPTYNFGLAGQTSDAIAARQGGAPAYYAPVGGSIPASGAVTLTPAFPGPCRSLSAPVALKCNLAGVDGTFTWDGTSAVFTRETAGDAVPVSVQVPLFVYPITTVNVTGSISKDTQFDLHDECINIFWIGRNNLSETDLIMQNMVSMVEYVKNIGQKIVILAEFNSSGEPTGSAGFNQMTELNRRYKEKYPDFYCEIDGVDVLQNFINNANPDSPDDMSDVASGLTPRSLRYDNLHPSQQITGTGGSLTPEFALDYGANVNANFVKQFLINKGWL